MRLFRQVKCISGSRIHTQTSFLKSSCMLHHICFADIISQCRELTLQASSATRILCSRLMSGHFPSSQVATLLSVDLNPLDMCVFETDSIMNELLLLISSTESRDPRDPKSPATNFLNICHSACRQSSTAVLLALVSESLRIDQHPGSEMFRDSFCTNPVLALLWQHANNSPRECSDSLISIVSYYIGMPACVLRSMLPSYVAMCDAQAVQCEQALLDVAVHANACNVTALHQSAGCTPQCSDYVQKLSNMQMNHSGLRCLESMSSIQEILADNAHKTCSSSKLA